MIGIIMAHMTLLIYYRCISAIGPFDPGVIRGFVLTFRRTSPRQRVSDPRCLWPLIPKL